MPVRTTTGPDLGSESIRRATMDLWRGNINRQLDIYYVHPQPDLHRATGITFVVDIRRPGVMRGPTVLTSTCVFGPDNAQQSEVLQAANLAMRL